MRRIIAILLLFYSPSLPARDLPLDKIQLPPGFKIHIFSDRVPGARSMTLSPKGTLFVGTRREGKVYALVDRNRDQKADQVYEIASGLNLPNGVAFRNGSLYVAEVNRILRFDQIERRLAHPPKPVVVTDQFPSDRHHGWKFIAFGPDGKLYVPVGAPCNICERSDLYASITRIRSDGKGLEMVARGVRNSVGFDWDPATKELWFTDNGRDWLGDDLPPDELNRATRDGLDFGFPYCYGNNVPDPKYKKSKNFCAKYTVPEQNFQAHVAALGMRFYTGKMFPPEYRGQVFLAQHGSWNRSRKVGYRVVTVKIKDGKALGVQPFAAGWLHDQSSWGRPVDVQVMPDGALLISDDQAGAIYRVSYSQ
jgi:glucose/arabinose dehydrogenase